MNEMGVTHEGIFFDVGGVAEDFKLYLIDRHFVQGKFEYVVFERVVFERVVFEREAREF